MLLNRADVMAAGGHIIAGAIAGYLSRLLVLSYGMRACCSRLSVQFCLYQIAILLC